MKFFADNNSINDFTNHFVLFVLLSPRITVAEMRAHFLKLCYDLFKWIFFKKHFFNMM